MCFILILQGGGGPIAIIPINKPGRMEVDLPVLAGHSAPVLDFEFNPFHDQMIYSASEDTTIKVWNIPEGGLKTSITKPLVDLQGHNKKVTLLRAHPTAENILASVSGDHSVKLWDIGSSSEINTLSEHRDIIQDIVWDYDGTQYATSCKDKSIRFVDARSAQITNTIENAHEGAKSMKLTYLGSTNKIVTTGFTRQSQRQFKIWDPRNTSKELEKVDVDQAAGVILPFFDPDTNMLYLSGKGDGNIRYYEILSSGSERKDNAPPAESEQEISDDTVQVFPLSDFRSSVSAKGMAWVPKRGLNIMACETARLLKLTVNTVEPLSFFVPRKSESFQDDLYPETASNIPAHSAMEWLEGSNKVPNLMSLDPAIKPKVIDIEKKAFVAPKTSLVLQKELDQANIRIKLLEERLAAAGISIE